MKKLRPMDNNLIFGIRPLAEAVEAGKQIDTKNI